MVSPKYFEGFKPELLAVKVGWKLKKKFYGEELKKKDTATISILGVWNE